MTEKKKEREREERDKALKRLYEKIMGEQKTNEAKALYLILTGYWIQQDPEGPRGIAVRENRPYEAVAMENAQWIYKDKAYWDCLIKNKWDEATGKGACRFEADTGLTADMFLTQQQRDISSQDFLKSIQGQIAGSGINLVPILRGVGILGLLIIVVAAGILYIKNR